MNGGLCFCILLIATTSQLVSSQKNQELIFLKDKLKSYDARQQPSTSDGQPTVVEVQMYIKKIGHVCETDFEWTPEVDFRMRWNDQRLKFSLLNSGITSDIKQMTVDDPKRIWLPDVFFDNERSAAFHDTLATNVVVRIDPEGNVDYSRRIGLNLACPMNLERFPFDDQICSAKILSVSHTDKDLVFVWMKNPIQKADSVRLKDYTLIDIKTKNCSGADIQKTGFSCIQTDLRFHRDSNRFMKKVVLPTAIMTLLSFISFWMNPKKVLRIVLLATVFLMAYHTIEKAEKIIPRSVNYSLAIDCWTKTCLLFIILAGIEYAIVFYLLKGKQLKSCEKDAENGKMNGGNEIAMKPLVVSPNQCQVSLNSDDHGWMASFRSQSMPGKIDFVSRLIFPVAFGLFIVTFLGPMLMMERPAVALL